MVISTYFKLIRPVNLVIVALVQLLLQYVVLKPILLRNGVLLHLSDIQFILLVLTSLIITAGGYIINDIMDVESDKINKPEKLYVGRLITPSTAKKSYISFIIAGAILACVLAFWIDKLLWFLIYPAVVFGLYLYSKYLKKTALWGNVMVALFCAGVAFIVLFAEGSAVKSLGQINAEDYEHILFVFSTYIIFAFLSTFIRELIKDLEDMEGDRSLLYQTFPISMGIVPTKYLISFLGILLLTLLGYWTLWDRTYYYTLKILLVGSLVNLPLLIMLIDTWRANSKRDFSKLSLLIKIVMVSGILLIIFYNGL